VGSGGSGDRGEESDGDGWSGEEVGKQGLECLL
jgi:hypothetical protein